MKRRISIFFSQSRILICGFCLFWVLSCTAQTPVPFDVVFTGNLMSYVTPCKCPGSPLGGLSRFSTALKNQQINPETLLILDTGNFSCPNDIHPTEKNERILAGFEKLGVKAVSIGYRDLRRPLSELQDLGARHQIPFVSANLIDEQTNEHPFPTYRILNVGKIQTMKVGVIGVVQGGEFRKLSPEIGARLEEPIDAIKRELAALEGSVMFTILLTDADRETIAAWIEQLGEVKIDLILTSSNRTHRQNKVTIQNIPMFASGRQGKYLDRIIIRPNNSGAWEIKREDTKLEESLGDDLEMLHYLKTVTQLLGLDDM